MIKVIEGALKDYKGKKAKVETTLARIEAWEYALAHLDEVRFVSRTSAPNDCWIMKFNNGYSMGSPVENYAISDEEKEERLKEFIERDKSNIFPLQMEIKQIEKAIGALTRQERFIVESKYFEKMFWREIERNFNEKFRQQNYITESGLKKIKSEALKKLVELLQPFYTLIKIA
ncbi:hypothetical protein [Wukongibacter sp. M2B1]|uniref:hypothetical protein n=1 Tax=Wukongibacter sp. M2B1 TaxID=3088895 RepID=UPI003D7B0547